MKVSIITVCFNSENHIGSAIESVNMQDYKNIEHIFIDGASSDETVNIINSKSKYKHTVISEQDNGIYFAMNKGLNLVNGELIAFLNSDDYYSHDKVISSIVSACKTYNADLIWGNLNYVSSKNCNKVLRKWRTGYKSPNDLKIGKIPPHPSFFMSRKALNATGNFNNKYRYAADFDLIKRSLLIDELNKFYVDDFLVNMRTGGITNSSLKVIYLQNLEIINSLRDSFDKLSVLNYCYNKLCNKVRERF